MVAEVENRSTYPIYNSSDFNNVTRSGDDPFIPLYIYILVSVLNTLIFIMGTFGNFLVVLVIARVRNMRTPTNFFLLNLSVADILVLLVCQPAALMEFFAKDRWFIGAAMCKLVPALENGTLSVSIMTMMAVTAERYNAICNPFKRNLTCTVSMMMKITSLIWLVGFGLATPFLIMTDLEDAAFYDGTPTEVCRTRIFSTFGHSYSIFLFAMFFVLPFFILAGMYSKIIRKLSSDSLKLFAREDRSAINTLRSRKQVVRMLVIIIVLFFVSLCPFRVVTLWLIFTPTQKVKSVGLEAYLNLISFARILLYLNSACNPIVYSLTSSKFKKAFKMVLHKRNRHSRAMLSRNSMKTKETVFRNDSNASKSEGKPSIVIRLLLSIQPAHFTERSQVEIQASKHEMEVMNSKTHFQTLNCSEKVQHIDTE